MLLLTLPGMAAIHAGDEIGAEDVPVPSGEARDPFERRVPIHGLNRDPHRSPMRWRPGLKAGFTTSEPWLPVGDTTGSHNVESQKQDPRSPLNLYRSLIALRRPEPALRVGSYRPEGRIGDVLAYRRRHDGREFLVLLNFGDAPQAVPLKARGKVRLSTRLDDPPEEPCDCVCLRAKEGVIVECAGGM